MHPYQVSDEKSHGSPVRIHGKAFRCTLDLSSDVSCIRVDALHEVCDLMDDEDKERTYENVVKGYVSFDIRVNEDLIPVHFKIVRASRIPQGVQFGRDVLDKVSVFLKNDTAQFLKRDCKIEVKRDNRVFKTLTRYLYFVLALIGHVLEDTRFKAERLYNYVAMKITRRRLDDAVDFSLCFDEEEFEERWKMVQDFHELANADSTTQVEAIETIADVEVLDATKKITRRSLVGFIVSCVLQATVLPTVGYAFYEIYTRDLFFQNLFLF